MKMLNCCHSYMIGQETWIGLSKGKALNQNVKIDKNEFECTKSPFFKGGKGDFLTFKLMYFIPYNENLKEFSRYLRNNSTLAEVLLWQELRAGNIRGYKFNRQKPLGKYIVDFYCKKLNLVIEVDGDSHHHEEAILQDGIRQQALEELELNFLRFDDLDVKKQIPFVLNTICTFIDDYELKNPPNPL